MVLVEEAISGDTPRLEFQSEDTYIRLLAGKAKPASVTICEDDLGLPCVGGGGWFPHGFRWCGSRRPKLRTLHVWGVHVRIRICGYWLEWRSRLVGPFVKLVLDCHVLGRRCLLPTLPGDSFR